MKATPVPADRTEDRAGAGPPGRTEVDVQQGGVGALHQDLLGGAVQRLVHEVHAVPDHGPDPLRKALWGREAVGPGQPPPPALPTARLTQTSPAPAGPGPTPPPRASARPSASSVTLRWRGMRPPLHPLEPDPQALQVGLGWGNGAPGRPWVALIQPTVPTQPCSVLIHSPDTAGGGDPSRKLPEGLCAEQGGHCICCLGWDSTTSSPARPGQVPRADVGPGLVSPASTGACGPRKARPPCSPRNGCTPQGSPPLP